MLKWAIVLLLSVAASAEILDRIAVIVGTQAITEAQIDEELRVTAYLNRQAVNRDPASRRDAAARLVEQELVRREMDLSRYPLPSPEQVDRLYAKTLDDGGELTPYRIDAALLKDHLRFQLTLLRFIDYRFRPDIEIGGDEVAKRYAEELVRWKQTHAGEPPTLENSRDAIERMLTAQKVDAALSGWLNDQRRQTTLRFLDRELAAP